MKLKLKTRPEDFLVEEEADLPLEPKGEYAVYLLEKRGWNTVDLLSFLARKSGLDNRRFSYGGRKDRYGLTSQYISVKGSRLEERNAGDYALRLVGFMNRPMGPDLIRANKFKVSVRSLNKDKALKAQRVFEEVASCGYPNYFDDQRFGSFDPRYGFLAEKLLKKHFTGAAKIILCSSRPQDPPRLKARARFFAEHWQDWQACLEKAGSREEKAILSFLANKEPHRKILQCLSSTELSNSFSAYQSFLWNEVLRRIILHSTSTAHRVPGAAGDYVFYDRLEPEDQSYLSALILPTASAKAHMPDELSAKIYLKVLSENGLKPQDFNRLETRRVYFKSFPRNALVKPDSPVSRIEPDELYIGKYKLTLGFRLPRGSFATMLVKRIFL